MQTRWREGTLIQKRLWTSFKCFPTVDHGTALTAACVISLILGLPLMVNALWHLRVSSNASGRGVLRLIKLNYYIRGAIQ